MSTERWVRVDESFRGQSVFILLPKEKESPLSLKLSYVCL